MLALLPEFETPTERWAVRGIYGPKVNGLGVTPELQHHIREIELGRVEAPELVVDRNSMKLICTGDVAQQNVANWIVYKLGGFSTAPVRLVELSLTQRQLNNTALSRVQIEHQQRLIDVLGEGLDDIFGPPEEEDEGDADWLDEEEPRDPEELDPND